MSWGPGSPDSTKESWISRRLRDREPALGLGLCFAGILLALIIGGISYRNSVDAALGVVQNSQLTRAVMIAEIIDRDYDRTPDDLLRDIRTFWKGVGVRVQGEYLYVVDEDGRLLLHTWRPEEVGMDVGEVRLLDLDEKPAGSLRYRIISRTPYLGYYVDPAGDLETVALAWVASRDWMIGLHRDHQASVDAVRERFRPILLSFLLVVGVMIPSSLLLLHGIFRRDQRRRERSDRERHHLREQLRQAQRIEALGTLAGGIAHDFNNILSAIIGNTQLAEDSAKRGADPKSNLDAVIRASRRGQSLVDKILRFSRKGEKEHRPVHMREVVEEALELIEATLPRSIRLVREIGGGSDVIFGDPTLIRQIVVNLCSNAIQAMRAKKEGVLTVKVSQGEVVRESGQAASFRCDGCEYRGRGLAQVTDSARSRERPVCLTVHDTGHGMSKEVQKRIFEPFFTTRPVGEGTGLGLSVAYGIVADHGGEISVSSHPEVGTAFHVCLPVLPETVVVEESPPGPIVRGKEHILLVEDDISAIGVTRRLLESLGYRVTVCATGSKAIDLLRRDRDGIDLILTGRLESGTSGIEVAREVRATRPDLPVLLCAGRGDRVSRSEARAAGVREILRRPIPVEELSRVMRNALD
jgi:signal transduction histidine kinase/CheY-like chemotaxis protein